MNIPFSKFSGAGNDFIMIDNRDLRITCNGIKVAGYEVQPKSLDLQMFISKVCRRGLSVGADGVILIEKSDIADFKMRYFNADGSEADTCGNGARCTARFAYLKGIVLRKMRFETRTGIYDAEITEQGTVKVKMNNPSQPKLNLKVPTKLGILNVHFINTGVPHLVVFISDMQELVGKDITLVNLDIFNLGRELRYHPEFQPTGTNVNFVEVVEQHKFNIRTYERGVENETLACGTGSIAGAIIAYRLGKMISPVAAHTQGGSLLKIYFDATPNSIINVYLEGDARFVYEGILFDEAII